MILCAHSSHMHLNCSISLDCLGKMQCMCPMLMNLYARIVAGTSLSASEYALYRAYAKHDMNVSHLHLCPGCISVICKGRWDHHTELMEKAVDVRVWESQTSDIDKYKFLSDPCSRLANDSCENCCDCTKLRRRIVYAYCMQKTNPRICKYIFFYCCQFYCLYLLYCADCSDMTKVFFVFCFSSDMEYTSRKAAVNQPKGCDACRLFHTEEYAFYYRDNTLDYIEMEKGHYDENGDWEPPSKTREFLCRDCKTLIRIKLLGKQSTVSHPFYSSCV